MSTGWNFNFKKKNGRRKKGDLKYVQLFSRSGISTLKNENVIFEKGLNCGPAGRNALIRWIEYNYKMKNDEENSYPAVNACKIWQKTQSFQDVVLSGMVDFLKFLNVPKHVTYKNVFDNYLSPNFINKINSIGNSQKSLIRLASKMTPMFQVREIQPLFSVLLEKINVIPVKILNILVEDTPAAQYFYEITCLNVKRKIWVMWAQKFYEEIEQLVEEIIIHMKLNDNHEYINNLINKIIDFIGDGTEKYYLYNLCIHIIRLKSVNTILNHNEYLSSNHYNDNLKYDEHHNITMTNQTNNINKISKNIDIYNNNIIINDKKNKEPNKNYLKLNLNFNNISENQDLQQKLIKLQSCFDNIMNNNNNKESDDQKEMIYSKENTPYYLQLHEYYHNSTSFKYLKKRKNEKYGKDINIINDEKILLNKMERETDSMRLIKNPQYIHKEDTICKRILYQNRDDNRVKKIKYNMHDKDEDNELENIVYMERNKIEEKTKDALVKDKENVEEDNLENITNKNMNNNNNKISRSNICHDNITDTKEKFQKTRKIKTNNNAYYDKKNSLPFDNMFYSKLRLLLCMQYKEKYNVVDNEMIKIDKYFYFIEFINNIIKDGIVNFIDEFKTKEIIKKMQYNFKITNIDDLYEYSLLLNNIQLKFSIIEGICFNFHKNNFDMITQKCNVHFWISLFYLGIYNNFFSLIKYAIDKRESIGTKKKDIKKDQNDRHIIKGEVDSDINTHVYNEIIHTEEEKDYYENKENVHEEVKLQNDIKEIEEEEQNEYAGKDEIVRDKHLNNYQDEKDVQHLHIYEFYENGQYYQNYDDGMKFFEEKEEPDRKDEYDDDDDDDNYNDTYNDDDDYNNINHEYNKEHPKKISNGGNNKKYGHVFPKVYPHHTIYNDYNKRNNYYESQEKEDTWKNQKHKDDSHENDSHEEKEQYIYNKELYEKIKKKPGKNMNKEIYYKKNIKEECMGNDQNRNNNNDNNNNNYNNIDDIKNDNYLKIPIINILRYIVISNDIPNEFFSFFDFFKEDNIEELKSIKEKNTILLLSALLNIPQIDYIKVKNFFSIIEEFFYLEKKKKTPNLQSDNNNNNMRDNFHNRYSTEMINVEEGKKYLLNEICLDKNNIRDIQISAEDLEYSDNNNVDSGYDSDINSNKYNSNNNKQQQKINNNNINNNNNNNNNIDSNNIRDNVDINYKDAINQNDIRTSFQIYENVNLEFDKEKMFNEQKEESIKNIDNGNVDSLNNKYLFEKLGRKLINTIYNMSKEISDNKFLINNNICSIYIYLNNCCKKKNMQKQNNISFWNKDKNIHTSFDENSILYMPKEMNEKFYNCNNLVKKYFPYILKSSFFIFNILKKKRLIHIYIKYMYLYEYLYHMILNRILYISTIKFYPFLQNIILKELNYYFHDFKNVTIKNFWKFYLYAHTLIDINNSKIILTKKLFHNNAIQYFIKLFYYLSFYNPIFSILFLNLIRVKLNI
ncbi:hypothetical protein PFNF54_05092 [Plasmodium falciparum NF54]|uniref:Uncharacterized protein n=1 Tax=Plasmodium falciparum (isolate NF54) TaxID=5843 RepID=W7K987_PLAFO|nr:hypothetical protein PFNF54_05092 [Plasmodium falciparum NF54]